MEDKKLVIEKIDSNARIVCIKGAGVLQVQDFRELFDSLVSHPEFEPEMSTFWDLREADLQNFAYRDFQSLAFFMISRLERHAERHAIVVGNELGYGLMRIWQAIADHWVPRERRLFRDAGEAYGWLLTEAVPAGPLRN